MESGVRDGCMVIMVISIPPFCFRDRENSYTAKCDLSEWIFVYISVRNGKLWRMRKLGICLISHTEEA